MDAEYKDMNESAPIPSLTLEPELEDTPKLVVAEETKLHRTKDYLSCGAYDTP